MLPACAAAQGPPAVLAALFAPPSVVPRSACLGRKRKLVTTGVPVTNKRAFDRSDTIQRLRPRALGSFHPPCLSRAERNNMHDDECNSWRAAVNWPRARYVPPSVASAILTRSDWLPPTILTTPSPQPDARTDATGWSRADSLAVAFKIEDVSKRPKSFSGFKLSRVFCLGP